MLPKDPEMEVERHLRQYLLRKLGRWPTDEDIKNHLDEESAIFEKARVLRELEAANKNNEERTKQIERRNALEERQRTRNIAPSADSPVRNLEELETLSKSGQAYCVGTKIEGSKEEPIIVDIDLEFFNFNLSMFRYVTFGTESNLSNVSFIGSKFESVIFENGSSIEGSDFSEAEFGSTHFKEGCRLDGASFRFAKFKRGNTVEFDRNYISGASFLSIRTDEWSQLSRSYSGIFQYINIAFSGIYFGIILLKLYLFKSISVTQSLIENQIRFLEENSNQFSAISVFEFVFGSRFTSLAIAMIILCYQAARLYLTMRIGPLIEAERQTGYTPRRSSFEGYLLLHLIVRVLGVIAVLLFIYELWDLWSQRPIVIPKLVG
ncbi:pentapeptide repeat-containing protein [Mesorhizobium neociceri]|uniref:Pentapeptide repeat-containing protein n=1 Tax=Mesorhizobium neociceri TaxID=1307853 RepID=A0A838AW86_9HYPH|nr:pentapeptide repeat-containing protein [Mesorhizobium neociceri]MBA1138706.1 pentapeptide repeat-containing protein [Mesorhizobium neociceri]